MNGVISKDVLEVPKTSPGPSVPNLGMPLSDMLVKVAAFIIWGRSIPVEA
jgi:hypothetical protein